jgi:chromate transporter
MIYLEILWTFLKIGMFSFGGGYGLIAMIKQEVLAKGWMNEETLYNFIGISESTPGAISINLATFVGTDQAGVLGGLIATLGVVLPSFVIIMILARFLRRFNESKVTSAVMSGIQPVVLALIIFTGIFIAIGNFASGFGVSENIDFDYRSLIIMGVLGILLLVVNVGFKKFFSPILLIILSAGLGMLIY